MSLDSLYKWLVISGVKGLGNKTLKTLFNNLGSAERILTAEEARLIKILGETRAKSLLAREGVNEKEIKRVLGLVEKEGINFVTLESENYPQKLIDIEDPPPVVFYRGELKNVPLAGIVGTRKPTGYTVGLVKSTASKVVRAGMGVVSGGAKGVDWLAHEGAVESGGFTVCILGYGILKTPGYILNRLEKSNAVLLSEFPPLKSADRYTFPKRNRLIAAMGEFIFIPEAGAKSGSLITANYALKYGKKVYVHIGIGSSDSWEGCYRLLKEGKAEIVKDIEEVLKTTAFGGDNLINFLKTPRTVEELMEHTGKSYQEVNMFLTQLEIEGKVRKLGSHYQAL